MAQSLASSFIEVYKSAQSEIAYFTSESKQSKSPSANTNSAPVSCTNVFESIKAASLNDVKRFIALAGTDILDENGHTVVHWAAILGLNEILNFLMDSGASIHVQSQHEMGQFPIHWACVNNHQKTVNLLLENGAYIEQKDSQGGTPLVVAARYGSLSVCAYLLARGANISARDNDGDTALHLAAYGGYADLCRVLVYSGLSSHLVDEFGQTPLHLACISGDIRTVKDFCNVDKVNLNVCDAKGKRPIDLAQGRSFTAIVNFLEYKIKSGKGQLPKCSFNDLVYGPNGARWPLMFFVFVLIFWGYPMYVIKAVLLTWSTHKWLHYIFLASNVVLWISFYHCNGVDPGYLPRNTRDYDEVLRQVARLPPDQVRLDRLCHSCRTVKPDRSSHCPFCGRCVKNFDHHCPYIDNCVGANNRHSFVCFISSMLICGLSSIAFSFIVWNKEHFKFRWDYLVGLVLLHVFGLLVIYVSNSVWYNALTNITTNERLRWRRYPYLRNSQGHFSNSNNHGILMNFYEFFYFPKIRFVKSNDVLKEITTY